jgi:hypothetical protein
MIPTRKIAWLTLAAAAVLVPGLAAAQAITPKEIQETWVGRSLPGSVANGRGFVIAFKADGTITITGEAANDSGTWRLSDDGYCVTWKTIRAGTERCFTARRLISGEIRILNPDGSVSGFLNRIE